MKNANHTVIAFIFNHPRQKKHCKTQHFNKMLGCKMMVSWGRMFVPVWLSNQPVRIWRVLSVPSCKIARSEELKGPGRFAFKVNMTISHLFVVAISCTFFAVANSKVILWPQIFLKAKTQGAVFNGALLVEELLWVYVAELIAWNLL